MDGLSSRYALMDELLSEINKKGIGILWDGHCLPRAVYQGASYIQQCKDRVSYRSGFFGVNRFLRKKPSSLLVILPRGETLESASTQINEYFLGKTYAKTDVPSVSIDLLINIMYEIASCQIFVYYVSNIDTLKFHKYIPSQEDIRLY